MTTILQKQNKYGTKTSLIKIENIIENGVLVYQNESMNSYAITERSMLRQ